MALPLFDTLGFQPLPLRVQWWATVMQSRWETTPDCRHTECKTLQANWRLYSWQMDISN